MISHMVHSAVWGASNSRRDKKNSSKISLFSPVKGQLTLRGKPLAGITVTRTFNFNWRNATCTETVSTDENGYFAFDERKGPLILGTFLPHETAVPQSISADYQGLRYPLWLNYKRNYDLMGEFSSLKKMDKLDSSVLKAYRQGYILLNGDLMNRDTKYQKLNRGQVITSICDLELPYQTAIEKALTLLHERYDEFSAEIVNYFSQRESFFDCLDDEDLSEYELEKYAPYRHVKVKSVDFIHFSKYLELYDFEENYLSDSTRMVLNGEIMLNLVNSEGQLLRARVWLNDARFDVIGQDLVFLPKEDYFKLNPSDIDPESKTENS